MDAKVKQRVKQIFERKPDIDELWVTEDGRAFYNERFAKAYALGDHGKRREKPLKVEHITRDNVMNEENVTNVTNEENGKGEAESGKKGGKTQSGKK